MRRLALYLFLSALISATCAAAEDTVASLKSRLENASGDERAEVSIRIAQLELRTADQLYNEGRVDDARAAIEDVVNYSTRARDAAIQTKKRLKNVEIDARKMAEKLRDIKRTLAFEDQSPVDKAIHQLEEIRTALLKEMFSDNKNKKDKQ